MSRIAETTARPDRNMEEEPTLTTVKMMSFEKWKFRMDKWSRLLRVM